MPLPEWPYTPSVNDYTVGDKGITVQKPTYPNSTFTKANNSIQVAAVERDLFTISTESRWGTNNSPSRVHNKNSGARVHTFNVIRPLTFYREID